MRSLLSVAILGIWCNSKMGWTLYKMGLNVVVELPTCKFCKL